MARSELRANQKFKRLVRKLNLPAPYVVGLLECMWQCGYASGNDLLGDADDVEVAAEWPGKEGEFFKIILDERWIDERKGKYHIHDLFDHAPDYVRKRMERRKNKDLPTKTADTDRQTAENGVQCPPNGGSTQPTHPNPPNTPNNPTGGSGNFGRGKGLGRAGYMTPDDLDALIQKMTSTPEEYPPEMNGVVVGALKELGARYHGRAVGRSDVSADRLAREYRRIYYDSKVTEPMGALANRLQLLPAKPSASRIGSRTLPINGGHT